MNYHPRRRARAGMTIIGNCMVLVLLTMGLIALFSLHSLKRAADLRSVIAQADAYTLAYHTFHHKYLAAPGDYSFAAAQWGSITADGDGDGTVRGWQEEEVHAFQHLALADILPETDPMLNDEKKARVMPGVNIPASHLDNAGFLLSGYTAPVYGKRTGNMLELGGLSPEKHSLDLGALTAADAREIDRKIDDGLPNDGRIYALTASETGGCVTGMEDGGAVTYLSGDDIRACRMVFWLD